MTTIYEKYGGFDFFHRCIYDLYLSMFDHPEIAYHFVGVDLEKLSLLQAQFLVRAIGGPDEYQGGSIQKVHHPMGITPFEFNEIAVAFKAVFVKNGVTPDDVTTIMNFVASHQTQVVTERTALIDKLMIPIYRFWRKVRARVRKLHW